ncbi:MAG: hypothetical protein HQK76_00320 [Desulfobacterales bacterium]|nr:hypothetical protein [Desulfobacterales bacterium]
MGKKFLFFCCFFVYLFNPPNLMGITYQADTIPWSGYWWPFSYGGVSTGIDYRGKPSPLDKYSYVVDIKDNNSSSSFFYYYKPDSLPWEGMCFYWAAASIVEKEPIHKGIYKGIVFYVGDKKGLLTVLYNETLYNQYDIYSPADFHRLLIEFLGNKKSPFIFDIGGQYEVWNYPVFKCDINYTQIENTQHYTTKVYYATDDVSPDYVGTIINTDTYEYKFVFDDAGNLIDTYWGNSTASVPRHFREPYAPNCTNPSIDRDSVIKIVNTIDDELEENDTIDTAKELKSGHYSLIGMDVDYFYSFLEEGDRLNIFIFSEEDDDISLKIFNSDNNLIKTSKGSCENEITADKAGKYYIKIDASDIKKEPVYSLYIQKKLTHTSMFLLNPSNLWHNGIAMLLPDKNIGRVLVTQMDTSGLPIKSYNGIVETKQILGTTKDAFGLSENNNGYLRIDSDTDLYGLQCVADGGKLMLGSNLIPSSKYSSVMYFPNIEKKGYSKISFGLINNSETQEILKGDSFREQGNPDNSENFMILAGQKIESDYLQFITSQSKTMFIKTESGNPSLIGYIKFEHPSFITKSSALIPLPLEQHEILYAPHVALSGNWFTEVAFMNVGVKATNVEIQAYDDLGNLIDLIEISLNQYQNYTGNVKDVFPISSEKIASLKILSKDNEKLCGYLLYGSTDGEMLAGIPLQNVRNSSMYLPHIASFDNWHTGIGIMNPNFVQIDISFELFNEKGTLLSQKDYWLNPNQRIAKSIEALFGNDLTRDAKYLKITTASGLPLTGIYKMLMTGKDGLWLMGDIIP